MEIINALLRRSKDSARNIQKPVDPIIQEHGHVVLSLIPRLNETLFEILSEEPFQGVGFLLTEGGAVRYSGEKIITSLVGFSLQILGGKVVPEYKVSLSCRVEGIEPHDSIRAGDLLTVDVNCERLHHESVAQKGGDTQYNSRVFMALVNFSTD